MKTFLKENYVLVCGLALPVLLTIVFFVAARVPFTAPPRYKFVYAGNYVHYNAPNWLLQVKDRHLYASYTPPDKCCDAADPVLHVYDPIGKNDRPVSLPSRKDATGRDVLVPGLEDVVIDSSTLSPDGYVWGEESDGAGLITELFAGSSPARRILRKDGYRVEVPGTVYDTMFFGWVIE